MRHRALPDPPDLAPRATARDTADSPGDLTQELLDAPRWTDEMVERAGIPVTDTKFVTVGGGIGSFVMVDYLRLSGLPAADITVLGEHEQPWASYQHLTRVSQIPRGERLRSDSASTPDNIWGFPSYALRETFGGASTKQRLSALWQVLVEPIGADYYTPKAGQVFDSLEREHQRIGYAESFRKGQVRMVRRRREGGYFCVLTPPPGSLTRRVIYRSDHVHLAVGYPGLKLLPDLQEFRSRYHDPATVVNAYEPHEHVYRQLARKPGTVIVRGGGIVASRVLQRLIDDRDRLGLETQIVHLFRTYVTGSHGPSIFHRRKGGDGWAYQGFNYPKSVWGGQLKAKVRKLEGPERAQAYELMGGTNTPVRRIWQAQLKRGRAEGWYRAAQGEVTAIRLADEGPGLVVTLKSAGAPAVEADFLVDCTGLESDIAEHRVLADLLDHSGAGRNPRGRLDVATSFEVIGTRSVSGRLYASGSATLGGPFPGVDTFLGLQIAALEICDDLAKLGFCERFGVRRSLSQWWRWMRNEKV
jgi:pSer/pThr/pTyr-binding forkhead associated (FHA) protein